jgi:pilus assembly protein Flp/PilA
MIFWKYSGRELLGNWVYNRIMSRLRSKISSWFQCVAAATAIEYGLIAGGISLAICAAVYFMGDELQGLFEALRGPTDSIVEAAENVPAPQ